MAGLAIGAVAFLLTNIEGSARLQQLQNAYAAYWWITDGLSPWAFINDLLIGIISRTEQEG